MASEIPKPIKKAESTDVVEFKTKRASTKREQQPTTSKKVKPNTKCIDHRIPFKFKTKMM